MANKIFDDVLGFSMRKEKLQLNFQVLCGDISKSTCDIIVYVNSEKRSQLPENEQTGTFIEKPAHQKGVKFIFHLNSTTGMDSSRWEDMVVGCIKEANSRECEDVAFDIDRACEDPSKMAKRFKEVLNILEYLVYPNFSKIYVKGIQVYTGNVFYHDMFTNNILRMTWDINQDGSGWGDNTEDMFDYKVEGHVEEEWQRLAPYEDASRLPDEWAEMETQVTHRLVDLDASESDSDDFMYSSIESRFNEDTGQKYTITKIQQVQIPWLYKMHRAYADRIEEEVDDYQSNTLTQLWHGCSPKAAKYICQEGFDMRHVGENGACYYGSGIYFSKSAKRPASLYATPDPRSGLRHVFWCKVAVGEYTTGEHMLLQPPIRPPRGNTKAASGDTFMMYSPSPEGKVLAYNSEGTSLAPTNFREMICPTTRPRDQVPDSSGSDKPTSPPRYHSVVDDINDPSLFVVFKDYAAYPEYMITFKEI